MVRRLWYCDVTQTSFVTSFRPIVLETFLRTLRLVTVFPPPYQLSCHSLFLIIESDSQHFHWLAFKKIFSIFIFFIYSFIFAFVLNAMWKKWVELVKVCQSNHAWNSKLLKMIYVLLVLFTCFLLDHYNNRWKHHLKKNQLKRNINHSATAENDIHLFGCMCQLGTRYFFCVATWLKHQKYNLFSMYIQ